MASQEQYLVSARKYRPATFQSVVGQRALTATLKNAITGGKLAQAYLFCGPRGVGKTSCARIFAKTINCQSPTGDGEACGNCESCRAIEKGSSFNLVELDAASNNSVDDIRNISDQVNIPAPNGGYRVFIIDEVHMLTSSAFNAFLKTLEEPPKNVVFILATTERHKVIPTILSRCQVYDFRRITINDIIHHLEHVAKREGVKTEREALGVIASKADGAMRDALSIFDQVVASTHGNVTYQGTIDSLNVLDQEYYFKLVDIFRKGDVGEALLIFKEITDKGFDAQFFINGLAEHVRNLMVSADQRTVSLLESSEEMAKRYTVQSASMPIEWYYNAIKILNDADYNYRMASNKRLLVELALIRLSRLLNVPFDKPDGPKPPTAPERKKEAIKQEMQNVASPTRQTTSTPNQIYQNNPTTGKKPTGNRPSSFRLTLNSGPTSTMVSETQSKPFSEAEFNKVWKEYIDSHPEQRILGASMRESKPEKISDSHYRVEVSHPAQKQAFESAIAELTDFFKKKLSNDFITLTVDISQENNIERGLSPKDFLKLAIEENPELAKFLKAVDAELET